MTSTVFPAPAVLETAAPIRRRIEASGTELQIYEWGTEASRRSSSPTESRTSP